MFVDEKRRGEIAVDPVRDLLIKARGLLVDKGWCQGDYVKDGALCCLGAIGAACGGTADDPFLKRRIMRTVAQSDTYHAGYCRLADAIGGDLISAWNDDNYRTKEEVLAAFDRAIAL
jgi:hypothetical protein